MPLFAIIALAIGLCFVIHWIALPITVLMRRNLTRRWLWMLGVLALPLAYIAAVQSGHLRSPSWRGWVTRAVIAGAVAFGVVQLGRSSWVNTAAVFEVKGSLVSLFTSEIASVEGRVIHTLGGNVIQNGESANAFPSAFAVASIAIVAGAMQFYGPIIKAFFLAVMSFGCSFVTTLVTEAWLIDAFATGQPHEIQAAVRDFRTFYNFHLWYLVAFLAAVLWAWYDIRCELRTATASPHDDTPDSPIPFLPRNPPSSTTNDLPKQ